MRTCERCGKTSMMAGKRKKLRGKYNPTYRSRRYPNLQWIKVSGKRMRVCANCFKIISRSVV